MSGLQLVAAAATAAFAASLVWALTPRRTRLAPVVRPYTLAARAALGRPLPQAPVTADDAAAFSGSLPRMLLARLVQAAQRRHREIIGGDDSALHRRLLQAQVYDAGEDLLVVEHRVRQVIAALAGAAAGIGVALTAGLGAGLTLLLGVLGLAGLLGRVGGAVDKAIQQRRDRMRAEIPAISQLLALRIRAGGSIVTALQETGRRCSGHFAAELGDALAQHRAGRPLDDALEGVAELTPEPEAARVHRMLATAIRHGNDVAPELLRIARDGRDRHLTHLRRQATRRRAALLLPTIGLLAPLMLLFIIAPLPGLVLGGS